MSAGHDVSTLEGATEALAVLSQELQANSQTIQDLELELVRAERRQTVYLDLNAGMREALRVAHDFLRRLSEWDMLWLGAGQPSLVADGPYWKGEIRRTRDLLAAVLAGEGGPAESVAGTCECGAPPNAMHYRGCPYLPEGHPGAAPGEPPIYAGEGGPAAEEDG